MHRFALVLVRPEANVIEAGVERLLGPFRQREEELLCPCQAGREPLPCRICDGTGAVVGDANRVGLFDWMMIGGRFDGRLTGQPPDRFTRLSTIIRRSSKEPETLDDGRVRLGFRDNEEWQEALTRARHELVEANAVRVMELPADVSCSIVVTPDGWWHERGFLGEAVSDAYERDWQRQLRALLSEHTDCVAVGCDIHV